MLPLRPLLRLSFRRASRRHHRRDPVFNHGRERALQYGTTANTAYASLPTSFSATSTTHSATITGFGQRHLIQLLCPLSGRGPATSIRMINAISFSVAVSSGGNGPVMMSGNNMALSSLLSPAMSNPSPDNLS